MVVVGGFVNRVSVKDQPSVAFVTLVADAQPVRTLSNLSFASVDEFGVHDKWRTSLTANEGPRWLSVVFCRFVTFHFREVHFYHF